MSKQKFQKMCSYLAAYECYKAGATIAAIASQAKVSESTIRRWLKTNIPDDWMVEAKLAREVKK